MKSSSGSAPRPDRWRLSRTLSRKVEARPLEESDLKYVWAAYRKGQLASMGEAFASADMEPREFTAAFLEEFAANYHGGWTLLAETSKGFMPVGIVLGFFSHPRRELSPFMIVGDMVWFPWASSRNRIEAAVHFFNEARKEIQMVEYARAEHKKFFETIAKHGVMRRIGTMFNVYPGEATAVFETRAWH